MGILVDKGTKVIVQGITGKEGSFHTQRMLEYGTKIVGGITPGKGGKLIFDIPIFNTVNEAMQETAPDASIIFVPAPFAMDSMLEAIDAGIKIIVCITDGVPATDMLKVKKVAEENNVTLIGPNCPGIITAGQTKLGIMPAGIFTPGAAGLISRSGTLTYEVVDELSKAGIGQTTCVGIGGDPIIGSSFLDIAKLFHKDPKTKILILIGEIGGTQEEEVAAFIKEKNIKAVAFIAGRTAPPGKRMGHAGAIVSGGTGTAEAKIKTFKEAGVPVADTTYQIVDLVKNALDKVQV